MSSLKGERENGESKSHVQIKKTHTSSPCRLPWRLLRAKDWLSSIPHSTPSWYLPLHRNEWEPLDKKVDTRKYRTDPKSIFEYEPGKSSVLKLERTVCHHLLAPVCLFLSACYVSCSPLTLHPYPPPLYLSSQVAASLTARKATYVKSELPCAPHSWRVSRCSDIWSCVAVGGIIYKDGNCLLLFDRRLLVWSWWVGEDTGGHRTWILCNVLTGKVLLTSLSLPCWFESNGSALFPEE